MRAGFEFCVREFDKKLTSTRETKSRASLRSETNKATLSDTFAEILYKTVELVLWHKETRQLCSQPMVFAVDSYK